MAELIAQINLATNFLKSTGSTLIADNVSDYIKTTKSLTVSKHYVKLGRYFVTTISIVYLVTTILLCSFFEPNNDGQWGSFYHGLNLSYVFLYCTLTVLLTTTVICLVRKLNDRCSSLIIDDCTGENFKREICTLTVILIFFVMSYLLRMIYDIVIASSYRFYTYWDFFLAILTCIPFDIMPIYVVMLYHRRNLKQINNGNKMGYEEISRAGTTSTNQSRQLDN